MIRYHAICTNNTHLSMSKSFRSLTAAWKYRSGEPMVSSQPAHVPCLIHSSLLPIKSITITSQYSWAAIRQNVLDALFIVKEKGFAHANILYIFLNSYTLVNLNQHNFKVRMKKKLSLFFPIVIAYRHETAYRTRKRV